MTFVSLIGKIWHVSGCRNHPHSLRQAPLATGRNKRNKRTRGVCVTLLYIYIRRCVQTTAWRLRRASRSRESQKPWIRKERCAWQEKIADFSDGIVLRSVDRPILSTNRASLPFFVSHISASAFPRAIQFTRENVIRSQFHRSSRRLDHAEMLNIFDRTAVLIIN